MAGRVEFLARLNPRTKAQKGEQIELVVDVHRLHFFDPETGRGIYGGETEPDDSPFIVGAMEDTTGGVDAQEEGRSDAEVADAGVLPVVIVMIAAACTTEDGGGDGEAGPGRRTPERSTS